MLDSKVTANSNIFMPYISDDSLLGTKVVDVNHNHDEVYRALSKADLETKHDKTVTAGTRR